MILFKFPTRSRPDKFKAAIANITSLATGPYKIIVTADADDTTMYNYAMMRWVGEQPNTVIRYGTKVNKIEAVNRDIPVDGWDILVVMSDDMVFTVKGFDEQISAAFAGNFDQLVHFPDGFVNERLVTLPIMGREYYQRFGYVYHPDYKSLWCDNEQMEVAKNLGKYTYNPAQIYKHNHAAWTGERPDALLNETQAFYREDEITYHRRKMRGFPKESVY
jgi:hypothetical protein